MAVDQSRARADLKQRVSSFYASLSSDIREESRVRLLNEAISEDGVSKIISEAELKFNPDTEERRKGQFFLNVHFDALINRTQFVIDKLPESLPEDLTEFVRLQAGLLGKINTIYKHVSVTSLDAAIKNDLQHILFPVVEAQSEFDILDFKATGLKKGKITGVCNMAIEGFFEGKYFSPFYGDIDAMSAMKDTSCIPHGPVFLALDPTVIESGNKRYTVQDWLFLLFPDIEGITVFVNALDMAVLTKLISLERRNTICAKVLTYSELKGILNTAPFKTFPSISAVEEAYTDKTPGTVFGLLNAESDNDSGDEAEVVEYMRSLSSGKSRLSTKAIMRFIKQRYPQNSSSYQTHLRKLRLYMINRYGNNYSCQTIKSLTRKDWVEMALPIGVKNIIIEYSNLHCSA